MSFKHFITKNFCSWEVAFVHFQKWWDDKRKNTRLNTWILRTILVLTNVTVRANEHLSFFQVAKCTPRKTRNEVKGWLGKSVTKCPVSSLWTEIWRYCIPYQDVLVDSCWIVYPKNRLYENANLVGKKMSSLHLGLLNGTFLNFVKLEALRISLRLHFYKWELSLPCLK